MKEINRYNLKIFADFNQFLIQDENSEEDISELWTTKSMSEMLAIGESLIGIRTARNLFVPITIEVAEMRLPIDDTNVWDQIVECDLMLPSGLLVVMGTTDYFPEAKRIDVGAGRCRVRVYFGNLNSLNWNGLDGDDHYKISIWQTREAEKPHFIKRLKELS